MRKKLQSSNVAREANIKWPAPPQEFEYKFNKKQQNILKRAFGYRTFTEKLNDKIMNMNTDTIDKKLNKVGYRLKIQLKGQ